MCLPILELSLVQKYDICQCMEEIKIPYEDKHHFRITIVCKLSNISFIARKLQINETMGVRGSYFSNYTFHIIQGKE